MISETLQAGIKEEKARDKLPDGRSWDQLEEEFAAGMKKLHVGISYTK